MTISKDRIGIDIGKRLSPEDSVDWAIRNDVRVIDIALDNDHALLRNGADRLQRVGRKARDAGITVSLHTLSAVNAAETSAYVSEASDEYFDAYIRAAKEIGARYLIVHGGYHFTSDKPARMRAAIERLKRMTATAEREGVLLLLENHNPEPEHTEVRYMPHDLEESQHFFSAISSPNFGWAFTVNHAHILPIGIRKFLEGLDLSRCGEVRIADCRGIFEEHLRIGQGTIDFGEVFSLIEGGGYTGPYMLGFTTIEDMLADRDLLVSIAEQSARAA